ncbi:glycoside hydrolase family 113 [Anaerolinea thermophila]|uniref:CBM20 domain-containing protein n=2 Tax=Anaerolinea TaxID=233189 RepID=E8N4X4_ANATU|nr:carboxypeptidase regulatory-like domain-containing protein [Anaerolinea thermophila]BAJ63488.1 hypothetical protein ANT_14600 [Anaerolinea thermophila UNI-1]
MRRNYPKPKVNWLIPLLIFFLISCTSPTPTVQILSQNTTSQTLMAEVTFQATLSQPLKEGENLSLEVLDEVTGIALNPQRYPLQRQNDLKYSVRLPFAVGSLVKYRYIRESKSIAIEYNTQKKQIRYRLYYVKDPGSVEDFIAGWNDTPYQGPFGRIQGVVLNALDRTPVPNVLVTAAGVTMLTAADGSFTLDGLPPWTHHLVVVSLNGEFVPFQQGAQVIEEAMTPAEILVQPAPKVQVTFVVTPPEDSPSGIPIRMVGNISTLGNTFADLRGGMNVLASRAPYLTYQQDGTYRLTLELPVGLDLRYKYTLGDGFWNAERTKQGEFRVRQFIVPAQNVMIEDQIETWKSPGKGSISFYLTVPETTGANESISIQFNPYGWTEPLPMWPLGNHQWLYILYSPLDAIGETAYRFCRNDQCGIADDLTTFGPDNPGTKRFTPPAEGIKITEVVKEWKWQLPPLEPITVPAGTIPPKPGSFIQGVAFPADYHPSWQPFIPWAIEDLAQMNANYLILSPTWHFTTTDPPNLQWLTGVDATWEDLSNTIQIARSKQINIALRPTAAFEKPPAVWWSECPGTSGWWKTWLDRYRTFILHHAALASVSGTEIFILNPENLEPVLPGNSLPNGAPVVSDADLKAYWIDLIQQIRKIYSGKVAWQISSSQNLDTLSEILKETDLIFVHVYDPLTSQEDPQAENLIPPARELIENKIRLIRDQYDLPIVVELAYPSSKGSANGCIPSNGNCLPLFVFYQGGLDISAAEESFREQAEIYNAFLQVISQSEWVAGVVSDGYFPPIALADKSVSVRGKPAEDVLWFWFNQFHPKE